MKAKEVLNLLRITRQTLTKYVKEGVLKVETLPNGRDCQPSPMLFHETLQ